MAQVGMPVAGQEFIGRNKELAELREYLKMGQSVVIVAPRRFGKTSLALKVLQQIKGKDYFTSFIDVFMNPTLELLSTAITREVLKNHKLHKHFLSAKNSATALIHSMELKAVIDEFKFIIKFAEKTRNDWELMADSIDFVDAFSRRHNKKMICTYDEFGDLNKFKPENELVKLFHSKIQHHTKSTYIFSGSYESVMNQMFVDSKAPFHRFARIIRLGYLEYAPLEQSLNKRFAEAGIKVSDSYTKDIITLLKGHPYYTQLAFQQVVLSNALDGSPLSVKNLFTRLLTVEKDYIEKVWEDISANKEYVKTILAVSKGGHGIYQRLKPTGINIARSLKKLEGKGILFKDENAGYFISDPLLEKWINTNL